MQTRQDLGVLVPFQAYTADQKLFVDLAHHGTWDAGALTGHPRPLTWEAGCRRPCTLLQPVRKDRRKTRDHLLCTPILGSSSLNTEDMSVTSKKITRASSHYYGSNSKLVCAINNSKILTSSLPIQTTDQERVCPTKKMLAEFKSEWWPRDK